MLVVSPINSYGITAGKIYGVSDYDLHDGWIVNDYGEIVRIMFDQLDNYLDYKEQWFVLESSKKQLEHNSLIDLLMRVRKIEELFAIK